MDLDKFPASKVRQLAKRMESSKATAHHIKQVADDPQAVQINLLRHQCTELPAGKYKKKDSPLVRSKQSNHKNQGSKNSQVPTQHKKWFDVKNAHQNKKRCSKCGDSIHVEGFQCPAKSSSVKLVTSLDTLPAFVIRKSKLHSSQANQRYVNYKQGQYMQKRVPYVVNLKITAQARIHFACRSKCSAHKLIFRRFQSQPTR